MNTSRMQNYPSPIPHTQPAPMTKYALTFPEKQVTKTHHYTDVAHTLSSWWNMPFQTEIELIRMMKWKETISLYVGFSDHWLANKTHSKINGFTKQSWLNQ